MLNGYRDLVLNTGGGEVLHRHRYGVLNGGRDRELNGGKDRVPN